MTWITTISGASVNLLAIQPDTINLADIAGQLARIRRFNGATIIGYSVAAHAMHVCDLVRKEGGSLSAQLAALHHDSHKYLIGDMVTPVKQALDIYSPGAWASFESIVQRQVLDALRLRTAYVSNRKLIERANLIALSTERRDLQAPGELWPCLVGIQPDAVNVIQRATLCDDTWAEAFMERDNELRMHIAEVMGVPFNFECQ